MQAQDSSECKKSKKGRQYPAPPAGSKASGLGIAKEFINFLLDHDGSRRLREKTLATRTLTPAAKAAIQKKWPSQR